jgi:glucose-1-phosphate cytidylyltransferase
MLAYDTSLVCLEKKMKALILAGGLGTRLREETEFRPKPMVHVGGRPIIWHIMKNLSLQGIREFCIATGYKGEMLKDYFLNYDFQNTDVTLKLGEKSSIVSHGSHEEANWKVTIADTGSLTMTGGRVLSALKYLEGERFLCTYGDGLADIDLNALVEFHLAHKKKATVTAVKPLSRFGVMDLDSEGLVTEFREKPIMDSWVNGGFFVFEPGISDYLDTECVLEKEPLNKLASEGELVAYRHTGFWQPMDTIRESDLLNDLWNRGKAPWKNWS